MSFCGPSVIFGIVVGVVILTGSVVEGCSFDLKDVCQNVTCTNGLKCQIDTSYYCDNRFGNICSPIATCTYDQDPCKDYACPEGSACVNVTDVCDDQAFCTMKAQCNVRIRNGTCPDPANFPVHSCQNTCSDSDHDCPKDMKCCYSMFGARNFCGATWSIGNVSAGADTTSMEEDQENPRTAASRILHPWNKAPNFNLNPVVPDPLNNRKLKPVI